MATNISTGRGRKDAGLTFRPRRATGGGRPAWKEPASPLYQTLKFVILGLISLSIVLPILLVINVPARAMVKALSPDLVAYTLVATVAAFWASRRFFGYALRSYRSASS